MYLSVSSGYLPTGTHSTMENPCLIWCALTQNQALSEVGQCIPYLAQGGHSPWSSREAVSRKHVCAIFDLVLEVIFFAFTIDKHVSKDAQKMKFQE